MSEKMGIHSYIAGHVQGVWYRAATQDEAKKLNITGWAKNLPDGRVEVKAFGERTKLAELECWLKIGPEKAEVTEVVSEEIPYEEHQRFAVK